MGNYDNKDGDLRGNVMVRQQIEAALLIHWHLKVVISRLLIRFAGSRAVSHDIREWIRLTSVIS